MGAVLSKNVLLVVLQRKGHDTATVQHKGPPGELVDFLRTAPITKVTPGQEESLRTYQIVVRNRVLVVLENASDYTTSRLFNTIVSWCKAQGLSVDVEDSSARGMSLQDLRLCETALMELGNRVWCAKNRYGFQAMYNVGDGANE